MEKITHRELAAICGCSCSAIRSWLASYKFNKYVDFRRYQNPPIIIRFTKEFAKEFAKYLTGRKKARQTRLLS